MALLVLQKLYSKLELNFLFSLVCRPLTSGELVRCNQSHFRFHGFLNARNLSHQGVKWNQAAIVASVP